MLGLLIDLLGNQAAIQGQIENHFHFLERSPGGFEEASKVLVAAPSIAYCNV